MDVDVRMGCTHAATNVLSETFRHAWVPHGDTRRHLGAHMGAQAAEAAHDAQATEVTGVSPIFFAPTGCVNQKPIPVSRPRTRAG